MNIYVLYVPLYPLWLFLVWMEHNLRIYLDEMVTTLLDDGYNMANLSPKGSFL